jgi:hypothetical protein
LAKSPNTPVVTRKVPDKVKTTPDIGGLTKNTAAAELAFLSPINKQFMMYLEGVI